MAPVDRVDHNALEQQLKDIVQDLYQIMVQVSTYDSMGRSSKEVLSNEVQTLSRSLQSLHTAASGPPHALPSVPPELLEYVENGRNPDIYTREFVELVRRGNQLMRGKTRAFADFRDILAADMAAAMPELRRDVRAVCEATGGVPPPLTMTTAAVSGATATSASTSAVPAPVAAAPATANATPVLSHPAPPASIANGAAGTMGGASGEQPSGTATAPLGNTGL